VAVHLTRIYTRTGDSGTSRLADGTTIAKTDPRLVAYADCDETNAALGAVLALGHPADRLAVLVRRIQNELFDVGADLATPIVADPPWEPLRVTQDYIDRLEADCDLLNDELAPLDSFILPGGEPAAALLHLARTVARRAERSGWALVTAEPAGTNPLACTYLNRLSDLLFIMARIANPGGDVRWVPGGERNADAPRQRRRGGGAGAADTGTA
jgi:cob(I)alamin adenosyltransferase